MLIFCEPKARATQRQENYNEKTNSFFKLLRSFEKWKDKGRMTVNGNQQYVAVLMKFKAASASIHSTVIKSSLQYKKTLNKRF